MTDEKRQPFYTPPPAPGILPDGKRVFVSTDHASHWPVGCASVVVALSEEQARGLLDAELRAHGLNPNEPYTLKEIGQGEPVAIVLCDGQY
ncbi:hypothetical protein VW35_00865 [Devosia soli]|uniref:Uncharacterized protein n=1 Tax=Devosia soli TaxID=361041 RepID=A0A0F5LGU1_9HYPH|nr:hypothetical protein [Devosia soli]KKB80792.1 hypothetical protein VW35_00865 [Devosia soli]